MWDEAVVVDLPLVPVMATKGAAGGGGAALAAEELDVAEHLDAMGAGEADAPVRRGVGQRHAGGEDQRRDTDQSMVRRSAVSWPAAAALSTEAACRPRR